MSTGEIVRREEHGDALSQILGTGDTRAALAQVERNVRDVIEVARARRFVRTYESTNKKTGEITKSDHYGIAAWQLLGMTYGVTPIVEWVKPVDGGYQARAVAQTRDGSIVGAAEALCHHKEPGKQYKSDHDIAAMAQTRAMRNAMRAALGAALVLAGFDFPDPDAPATTEQVGLLHQLEREQGYTHEEGHEFAGVDSYRDLTREQAATLIDAWSPGASEDPGGSPVPSPPSPGEEEAVRTPSESSDAPATPEQFARAEQLRFSKALLLKRARDTWPDAGLHSTTDLTKAQMDHLLSQGANA